MSGAGGGTRTGGLGGFFDPDGTAISPGSRERALMGILELAANTIPDQGIAATFGHNWRTSWLTNNHAALFSNNGPLGGFRLISAIVLCRYLGKTKALAKRIYT